MGTVTQEGGAWLKKVCLELGIGWREVERVC